MNGKYDRNPSKKQNENTQEDKSVDRYNIVVNECFPGADSTEPYKD